MGTFRRIYNEFNGIETPLTTKDFGPGDIYDPEYQKALRREQRARKIAIKHPEPLTITKVILIIGEKILDILLDFIILLPKLIVAFIIGFIGMGIYSSLTKSNR